MAGTPLEWKSKILLILLQSKCTEPPEGLLQVSKQAPGNLELKIEIKINTVNMLPGISSQCKPGCSVLAQQIRAPSCTNAELGFHFAALSALPHAKTETAGQLHANSTLQSWSCSVNTQFQCALTVWVKAGAQASASAATCQHGSSKQSSCFAAKGGAVNEQMLPAPRDCSLYRTNML